MTEQLFAQQLESPSGTGRVEPRSASSLSATDTNKRDANRQTHSHWQIWRAEGNFLTAVPLSRPATERCPIRYDTTPLSDPSSAPTRPVVAS